MARDIDLIVIHSSATPASMDIGVAEIDRWHRQRGWRKVGYHYVIRRNGEREVGRHLEEVGAHAAPHNSHSIGICIVGGLSDDGSAEMNFEGVQMKTLKTLVYQLKALYPDARVVGHRDLHATECPSFDVGSWLKSVGLSPS